MFATGTPFSKRPTSAHVWPNCGPLAQRAALRHPIHSSSDRSFRQKRCSVSQVSVCKAVSFASFVSFWYLAAVRRPNTMVTGMSDPVRTMRMAVASTFPSVEFARRSNTPCLRHFVWLQSVAMDICPPICRKKALLPQVVGRLQVDGLYDFAHHCHMKRIMASKGRAYRGTWFL